MKQNTKDLLGMWGIILGGLTIGLSVFAGWVTHIVICLQDENYILLVIGVIGFPIGIVHGIGHWFGAW